MFCSLLSASFVADFFSFVLLPDVERLKLCKTPKYQHLLLQRGTKQKEEARKKGRMKNEIAKKKNLRADKCGKRNSTFQDESQHIVPILFGMLLERQWLATLLFLSVSPKMAIDSQHVRKKNANHSEPEFLSPLPRRTLLVSCSKRVYAPNPKTYKRHNELTENVIAFREIKKAACIKTIFIVCLICLEIRLKSL